MNSENVQLVAGFWAEILSWDALDKNEFVITGQL
jgi:hypothetical protein